MPIRQSSWDKDKLGLESLGRDIHVLEGHSTGSLLPRLRVQEASPVGTYKSADLYLAEPHNDVTFTFEPNFNGVQHGNVYEGLGLHVDTTTGEVIVDASPPSPTRRNFIIEVTARNITAPGEFKDRIRVQVHKAV